LCRRLWFDTDGDIQQRGHAFFMSEASSLQSDVVRESDARYFETDYLLKDLHQRTFRGGVVTLTGQLERRLLIAPLLEATRAVAGVVSAHDHLTYRVDDTVFPAPRTPHY
jgi:hypothetical protein